MAVNPNSLKNLTDITEKNLSKDEMSANGRKGGVASGRARKEKRDMRKRIQEIFDMTISDGKEGRFKNLSEANGKNLSVLDAVILKQVQKAIKGDTRALEFLRDTAGMKPTDKTEITATVLESPLQGILDQLQNDEPRGEDK